MKEDPQNTEHFGAVLATSVVLIGEGVDDTPLGREVKEMGQKVKREHDLTQLLGVSLRGVLPYAEKELASLNDSFGQSPDADVNDELTRTSIRVQRARQALNVLAGTPMAIDALPDDSFDDTFEISFDEDES